MQVAVAQLNPLVGDLDGNLARLLSHAQAAQRAGAELLVTPELSLCGYPPRDLLARPAFVAAVRRALGRLVAEAPLPMVVGAPVAGEGPPLADAPGLLANAALLIADGQVVACHRKNLLPNYDVFDEPRYFCPHSAATVVTFGGLRLGLSVCEDIWNDALFWPQPRYAADPSLAAATAGAQVLINISASPFRRGGFRQRREMLQATARRHRLAVIYVNQVGGQDSLIFDGRSLAVDAGGRVAMQAPAFTEAQVQMSIGPTGEVRGALADPLATGPAGEDGEAEVLEAICLGLRDYTRKCRLSRVVLGLSGGIDSAVVACLAARALGPSAVRALAMPSPYSSPGSVTDALALAQGLGISCPVLPLAPALTAIEASLAPTFAARPADVTEENLQARLRGMLLMAQANKHACLLLSTGNKSEVAVGYTTLYGDMCGGLAPISDLYKTQVYALAAHINRISLVPPIPAATLTKPPSAELRPNQADQDTLPPYPLLDAILAMHVEGGADRDALVAAGHPAPLVAQVLNLVAASEHKRRQSAPGLRLSSMAFGDGRRLPVAAGWRG